MEKYDILLNEIKDYLNKEEINYNTNNEVISAYDLYNIINEELKGLRDITIDSKINKKLRALSLAKIFSETSLNSSIRGNSQTCTIVFEKSKQYEPFSEVLRVNKDNGIDEIYFDKEKYWNNKSFYNFVKRNYDLILETLQTFEKYVELLGKLEISYYQSTKIYDDLFKVLLSINENGVVKYEIFILNNHELFEEYNKKWYKREGIYEFANKNAEEILKRIPVSPDELEEPFKSIYYKHKEKQNNKVKTLKMHN